MRLLQGVGDDAAVLHPDDAVGESFEPVVVRDDQGCGVFGDECADELHDLERGRAVERGRDLVADEQRRPARQRAGDCDALALTARELARAMIDAIGKANAPSAARATGRATWRGRPRRRSTSATFASAVRAGNRLSAWNTKPTCSRRTRAFSRLGQRGQGGGRRRRRRRRSGESGRRGSNQRRLARARGTGKQYAADRAGPRSETS